MSNLVKTVSDDSFQADVVQSATPVLVDFWAPWCGPCKAIAPILEELASTYQGKLQIAKISVDDNQEVPASFGIRNIPTLLFFRDGKLLSRAVGALPREEIERRLLAVIKPN